MSRKTLRQLYAEHAGKVSDKWSLYLTEYDRLFDGYHDKRVRLFEIGIQNGGSLEIWSKYFSDASALIGCDINPDCALLSYDDPRISVIVGDANAPEVRERVFQRSPQFDIIIDDGSHLSSDIIKSFALYFPRVVEGGVFIAEDLHCSYWEQFEGGLFDPYSSIAFFKRLADVISHEHWGIPKARADILRGIFTKYGCEVDVETLSQVHSVEFINSMCVVRKAPAADNGLGHRVIAGSTELVVPGHRELHDHPYQFDPIFDQSGNPWTARTTPPDEAIEHAELALANARQQIAELSQEIEHAELALANARQQIAELSQEITGLRNSTSWRITAPLRLAIARAKMLAGGLKQGGGTPAPASTAREGNEPVAAPAAHGSLRDLLVQRGHVFYRRYMKGTRLGRLIGQQILKRGLVTATELQISALSHDSLATQEAQCADALQVEADSHVPGFHLSLPLNLEVSDALAVRPRINVLLPSLRLKHMSGGPNTALLLAALLAEKGEWVRLVACDAPAEGEEAALYPHMDGLLQRPVVRDRIELVDAFDRTRPIAIGANDLFLATAWWTAQIAKYAVRKTVNKTFIYLIQDFEPILHEGSTFQARALETYGLPHIPVINTRLLLDHLVRESTGCYADPKFSANALWFEPALDRSYYFPDPGQPGQSGKKTLLFYARPSVARRNLFEIGVVALRQAVASGVIDNDNWEVWAMGEKLAPVALGNGVFLNPLPWMSFDAYAERVRTADLLLSLMLSPHPSYPPLEMAASGKLAVTNSFSVKTAKRMRAFSPNIIVAEPTAESVAAALENAAGRINAGLPSYDPSGAVALPSNWDDSLGEIVPVLLQRIHALRTTPPPSDVPLALGYPSTPKTEYESYRRACLARRRREGEYQQEPGLLSFVTSAYNTDTVFLEELGSSVLLQDGGMQFEWLILDNGSTNEDTRHALQELARHPGVRLERVEHNLGIIGGMRFCLEHARGRYILPLDSDDLIEPDCVHVLTRFIKDNNYPPLLYTDEDKLGAGRFGSPYFKPDWDPVLFLHSCYIAHLCAIDRELGLQLGLYGDKTAEGCHDWDSFIRFMNAGHIPCHVSEVLYSWRIHEASTSGNIASKSYITDSHRATLQRALSHRNTPHLELVNSPLFSHNVDWWYRRKHDVPVSCVSLAIASARGGKKTLAILRPLAVIDADKEDGVLQLAQVVSAEQSELVHLCWNGVTPDDDKWRSDAAGLLELFADAVMVGGTLHDGTNVVDGPRIFGFGNGYDCPDRGRPLAAPGYSAMMWKARSVSAVSSGHCVVRRDFLLQAMPTLLAEKVGIEMLGPWLGALAVQADKRVVFSPFMRAKTVIVPEDMVSERASAHFLSRFWSQLPDVRFYSPRLGLTRETAYAPVSNMDRDRHLRKLQLCTLPYADWLDRELQQRAVRYPAPAQSVGLSIVTPVYHGSDLELLDVLANAIAAQSMPVLEWLLVVNGPMSQASMDLICSKVAGEWKARLIVELQPIGIVASLRLGLEAAQGEYVVPVDADDLITPDAVQILAHEINRLGRPDLVYTDEDLLVENKPASPYLRAAFDPVLSLDNSTIWHLCAMKRDAALAANVYGDAAANWCQDWDAVSRIFDSGGRIAHVPEMLYHWRQHAGSTTNNAQGDPRSLDSVRHILERHIARTAAPQRFYVAEWPANRGARELYIARRPDDLPQLVWIGDVATEDNLKCDENAILVVASNGVLIESQQVFVEVARLLELHPHVGVVGGLVEDKDGMVVDGCYMVNGTGMLESPWLGQPASHGGPYALALKTQSVATTGNSLAFFRISALKRADAWPPAAYEVSSDTVMQWCGRLAENGWSVAFSPLVRARAGSAFRSEQSRRRPPVGVPGVSHALVRYGMSRNYQD
jgi:glycosyltransferase involved in cell wall biosynthesis